VQLFFPILPSGSVAGLTIQSANTPADDDAPVVVTMRELPSVRFGCC
jgi:hypothetical protein